MDSSSEHPFPYTLHTIDLHACGEPARVVTSGMPDIEVSDLQQFISLDLSALAKHVALSEDYCSTILVL
jgi:proline racemase